MKQLILFLTVALLFSCSQFQNKESTQLAKAETSSHHPKFSDSSKTIASTTPEPESKTITENELQEWLQRKLAEVERDTSSYLSIKSITGRTCCNRYESWYFDDDSNLKYYSSLTENDGTSYYGRYFFVNNKVAGGTESNGAEDFAGQRIFINDNHIVGFSREEDIFSDTTFTLPAENIRKKAADIESKITTLVNHLNQIPAKKWSENGQQLILEITRPVSDHESEEIKYSISKTLFAKLIQPVQN